VRTHLGTSTACWTSPAGPPPSPAPSPAGRGRPA